MESKGCKLDTGRSGKRSEDDVQRLDGDVRRDGFDPHHLEHEAAAALKVLPVSTEGACSARPGSSSTM
jgi:hypothetical protein